MLGAKERSAKIKTPVEGNLARVASTLEAWLQSPFQFNNQCWVFVASRGLLNQAGLFTVFFVCLFVFKS